MKFQEINITELSDEQLIEVVCKYAANACNVTYEELIAIGMEMSKQEDDDE